MSESEKEDERKRCYLCEKEILQVSGQEFKLQCEKGPPITVCEDCYDDAEAKF